LIGFILMITAAISMALSVVREKERGTMEQLRVTSLRPAELILGKVLPYLGISLIAAAIILLAARVLFGVVVRGPYLQLFLVVLIYLFGALGWGLLVSSFAKTQAMAYQVATVSSMLPAIFLSGFIFPIRSMPQALQVVTYAVPARYFLSAVRGIILKGEGLGPYRQDIAFLCVYAAVVFGLAWVRLVKRGA
jgi:ABC-2 type transport system permease protein